MALSRITNPFLSSSGAGNASITSPAANTLAFTTTTTERMRIDSSGNIGIGTASPNKKLEVVGIGEIIRATSNTGANDQAISIKSNSGTADCSTNIFFADRYAATSFASSYIRGTASGISALIFATGGTNFTNIYDAGAPTEKARINAFGIGLGGTAPTSGMGIAFPASQSSSSDANTLDDYEEGTFTPTILATTTNPTVSYGRQDGRYVKIGMLVYASGSVLVNTITGGSGSLVIGGFPFTSRNSSEADRTAINFSYVSGFSSTTIPTSGIFNAGTTFAEMLVFNSADARAGRTSYVNAPPAAGFNIYYTCCYCTTT